MLHNKISGQIIGAAIEVHRELGPGKDESFYENALARELSLRGHAFHRQRPLPVIYKGTRLDCGYRIDILASDTVVIELKAAETIIPVHRAQLLTYLKLGGWKLGLLINFNMAALKNGIERIVLGLPEPEGTAETRKTRRPEEAKCKEVARCTVNCGDPEAENIAREVAAGVFEVRREWGPGLLASAYEICLCHEFRLRGLKFERRKEIQIAYKGTTLGTDTILMVVEKKVVVHPLAVNDLYPVHRISVLSQLRLAGYPLGFVVNFNEPYFREGIERVVFRRS